MPSNGWGQSGSIGESWSVGGMWSVGSVWAQLFVPCCNWEYGSINDNQDGGSGSSMDLSFYVSSRYERERKIVRLSCAPCDPSGLG